MIERTKTKFKMEIALSHFVKETYLVINIFKWSISIGKLYVEVNE